MIDSQRLSGLIPAAPPLISRGSCFFPLQRFYHVDLIMSLAEELLADLDEVGGEVEDEDYKEEDIMEADQQLEDLLKKADQSVKAVAKLNDSEEVSSPNVLVCTCTCLLYDVAHWQHIAHMHGHVYVFFELKKGWVGGGPVVNGTVTDGTSSPFALRE